MKVLITGSSGSLGSLITQSLISKKISVTGIDIKEPEENGPADYFSFYKCSITKKDELNSIFIKEKPTHVIHLASTFNKVRDRKQEYEIDIEGSKNVLEVSDHTPSVKQFIYSSSATAYGGNRDNPQWINEMHPLNPGQYRYGLNKRITEEIFSTTRVRDDLHVNIVRICTVVGPTFNKPASVVSVLLKWRWLPEFCRENKVQFLHSDDFVSLMNLIINDDQIKGVFNLAPDSYSLVKDLLPGRKFIRLPTSAISGFLNIVWNLKLMNFEPAGLNNSIYPILLDPGKIISRFNYKFKYSSTEAFEDTKINNRLHSGIII